MALPKWIPIPSADSRFLNVVGRATDSSHPRGPFHFQRFSAKAGETASITVKGFRMAAPNQLKVAVVQGDDCFANNNTYEWKGVIEVLSGTPSTSTADEYTFSGVIPSNVSGKLTVCMCNEDS